MHLNKLKTPTAPATKGGAKRKLVSPEEMYRKNARHVSYEELTGRSFDVPNGEGSSSEKKKRTVSVEDDEDESMAGRSSRGRYEGVANPEEEEEDDRFFGDGLTSDQKDILDYVDEIDPEEVTIHQGHTRQDYKVQLRATRIAHTQIDVLPLFSNISAGEI